jgi:hypothetical protein
VYVQWYVQCCVNCYVKGGRRNLGIFSRILWTTVQPDTDASCLSMGLQQYL